jgi:hypothetical protein
MNKNLMMFAIVGLFTSNVFGLIPGRVNVKNASDSDSDIWITFNSKVTGASCTGYGLNLGGCFYQRIRPGKDISPSGSLKAFPIMNVYAYKCSGGKAVAVKKEGFSVDKDAVVVTFKNGKIDIKQTGKSVKIDVSVSEEGSDK